MPLETGFALGTQREGIGSKQHEMYMPNASPNARGPNATYIPPVTLGLALGPWGLSLGPRSFLDTNMLV